jgi:hypothetical protein
MKKIIISLLAIGLTIPLFSQVINDGMLDEVVVKATNYKYLNETGTREAAVSVNLLQKEVANYDLQEADFYQDDYDFYTVNFFIPDGKVVAAYDKDGNILRTIEKYNNVSLPEDVRNAVVKRFPGWGIYEDVYRITYNQDKGAKKTYKLTLVNGDKKMRVKLDENGAFL